MKCLCLGLGLLLLLGPAGPGLTAVEKKEPDVKLSVEEQNLLDLTNKARAKEKLPALKVNAKLLEAARGHAANMARNDKMTYVLDGKNSFDRLQGVKYSYDFAAENICVYSNKEVDKVLGTWMTTKLTRDQILNAKYTEAGIGAERSKEGKFYYSLVMAAPGK
jgi:uncharacterized protein YkwD